MVHPVLIAPIGRLLREPARRVQPTPEELTALAELRYLDDSAARAQPPCKRLERLEAAAKAAYRDLWAAATTTADREWLRNWMERMSYVERWEMIRYLTEPANLLGLPAIARAPKTAWIMTAILEGEAALRSVRQVPGVDDLLAVLPPIANEVVGHSLADEAISEFTSPNGRRLDRCIVMVPRREERPPHPNFSRASGVRYGLPAVPPLLKAVAGWKCLEPVVYDLADALRRCGRCGQTPAFVADYDDELHSDAAQATRMVHLMGRDAARDQVLDRLDRANWQAFATWYADGRRRRSKKDVSQRRLQMLQAYINGSTSQNLQQSHGVAASTVSEDLADALTELRRWAGIRMATVHGQAGHEFLQWLTRVTRGPANERVSNQHPWTVLRAYCDLVYAHLTTSTALDELRVCDCPLNSVTAWVNARFCEYWIETQGTTPGAIEFGKDY